ncbi:MAG: LysR family transcriptional regulator [Rubrivivax sp.]|nr:LysR family transcriptional regulator [Rubrivivax sp.]MBK7260495.1 LysR family transcriptional regulator [Rubrivivax sp.]MBK8526170.1 LysR family transcriptional regulator [Rubrivivax sp.]
MADRRLQVFHAVAKHLSFTKAAEALFMTQPAVTFQIRQLEEQFHTRLFDRGHGRVSLTAAGILALDFAERILSLSSELDNRLQELGGQLGGPLHIGASTTIADYLLPRVLGAFKANFPTAVPRLFVANSDAVQARVLERSLDVGFIEGDSHMPALVADVVCDDELQITCAPTHPLAQLTSASAQSLLGHAHISREPGSGTREVVDHYLLSSGVAPDTLQGVMELGSPEALKGLVATGLGFSIMSRATVVNEIRLGQLVQIPLEPRLIRQLSVVYPKERIHSGLVSSFVEFAKQALGATPRAEAAPGDVARERADTAVRTLNKHSAGRAARQSIPIEE